MDYELSEPSKEDSFATYKLVLTQRIKDKNRSVNELKASEEWAKFQ